MFDELLLEEILSEANLRTALKAVKRNKGAPGVDNRTIAETVKHLDQHWPTIRDKLYARKYKPGAVKGVVIPKPSGGERLLGIPTVQDRLIQQAIHQQLSAIYEPVFSPSSFGFRPGRSAHDAIRATQSFVRLGQSWCVDIDISAFFDQVDHDILMHKVSQRVSDKRVLRLIGNYLRAGMQLNGQVHKRKKGTPQGGPLSPLLANIYLDALDKELESRGLNFSRYADDLNIYVNSQRSAERVYSSISGWIEKHLKLPINRNKSGTGRPWERTFLGFQIDSDGNITIARSSLDRYKDKVRSLWDARQGLTSEQLVRNWRRFIVGWWNYFGISVDRLKALSGWTRHHMRKCFWQRWHSRRGRQRQFRRLGVKPRLIKRVDFYAGAWRASVHPAMHSALRNDLLRHYGLVTPYDLAV